MRPPWTHNETSLKKPKQTNAWSPVPHAGPEHPLSFLNAGVTGMYHARWIFFCHKYILPLQ